MSKYIIDGITYDGMDDEEFEKKVQQKFARQIKEDKKKRQKEAIKYIVPGTIYTIVTILIIIFSYKFLFV